MVSWVGALEHLGGGHPEASLGAAALLEQQGLEAVAAGAGAAKAPLDGARLAGEGQQRVGERRPARRCARRGHRRGWGREKKRVATATVLLRVATAQNFPL